MKRNEIILLLISVFSIVICIISYDIYYQAYKHNSVQLKLKNTKPINDKFDNNIINKIKTRIQISFAPAYPSPTISIISSQKETSKSSSISNEIISSSSAVKSNNIEGK